MEYNGQQLSYYDATQRQRGIERNIRRWKREYTMLEAAGEDTTEAAAKLAKWRAVEKDFCKQTGLPRDSARIHVYGFGHGQASRAVWESRKLRDVNLDALPITQKSIQAIMPFECELLDSAQQRKLQNEHRKLLVRAAGKPAGTEVGATFTISMQPLHQMTGKDAAAHIRIPDEPLPYIAIHSHPSGNTFSESDLINFVNRDNMKILTAIGNNGRVYAVEKGPLFSRDSFSLLMSKLHFLYPEYDSSPELYVQYIEALLKEVGSCGIRYYSE